MISVVVKSSSKALEVAVAAGVVFEVKVVIEVKVVVIVVVDGEVVKSSSEAMVVAGEGASLTAPKVVSSSCL